MARLLTEPNLGQPDEIYQQLIDLHTGCSEAESHLRNAKLILCLVNHIGDPEVVADAIAIAKGDPQNEL